MSRVVEKASGFIRDLREYTGPFYYGASTNALGGAVFGLLSYYFNPMIPMQQALPYVFLRVLFGAGSGVAYSLGAFCFSLPYLDEFTNLINKRFESGTIRDAVYSFLSLWASFFILVVFAYFLFFVYGGRIPVKMNGEWTYLTLPWFISSLSHTNWSEVALIPVSGILIKGSFRVVKRFLSLTSQNQLCKAENQNKHSKANLLDT